MKDFEKIVTPTEKLRGKNGFLWDRTQAIESLKNGLMSEAKEVEKAIKAKDYENLKEELGDLLWSIVLISQVAKEEGLFNINDVLKTAIDEIGRMEFFSEKFKEKVYEVIRSNKPLIAVVHRNYESRFKIFGKMITITKDNREKLPHLILNLISV